MTLTNTLKNNFDQGVADAYIENYDLDKHVEEIKALYKKRRDLILKTMEEEFPEGVEWTHPEGGLFLWVTVPLPLSAMRSIRMTKPTAACA